MSSKTCFKCKMQKSYDAFYRHQKMADGYLGKCKECTKADMAKHRTSNIERIRDYDRRRSTLPHRVESRYKIVKRWQEEHPDWNKAQDRLGKAVRAGKVVKPNACLYCGSAGRLEGHHPDYSRPLDVIWLCVPCHRQTHAMARKLAEAA